MSLADQMRQTSKKSKEDQEQASRREREAAETLNKLAIQQQLAKRDSEFIRIKGRIHEAAQTGQFSYVEHINAYRELSPNDPTRVLYEAVANQLRQEGFDARVETKSEHYSSVCDGLWIDESTTLRIKW